MLERSRIVAATRLTAAIIAVSVATPARAEWSAEPVTVTPTTASIPLVEGCTDGAYGTFVAWQEGSVLRAQHLLPTGALDPAWPAAGVVACDVAVARSELVALPDRLGGLYLLWKEGAALYATRLDATGAIAAGWPARGRLLGPVSISSPRPSVIEDGANGFYAAWVYSDYAARGIHLGPANTGAGGWPNGTRTIAPVNEPYDSPYWPQLALAPDGGAFVAWASASADTEVSPSGWRLRRLGSAGLDAPGWSGQVLSFGSFHRELLGSRTEGSLLALSPDDRGGVFLTIGNPVGSDPYAGAVLETRVYRLQGDGQSAPDWPAKGSVVSAAPSSYYLTGEHPDASYRVFPDGRDGVLAGGPVYYDHGTSFGFLQRGATGPWDGWWYPQGQLVGHEVAVRDEGGLFLADFYPNGPSGPYQPSAFLRVNQMLAPPGWDVWTEWHDDPMVQWYGDIGLAPTRDGGTVLFWSQVRERIGLFARRFNAAGEITAVGPESGPALGLSRLRFVPGAGVRAAISLAGQREARFELFDVAGRRIASQAIEPEVQTMRELPAETTLAGTAALPSGLYFGRLVAGADAIAAKLIVAR